MKPILLVAMLLSTASTAAYAQQTQRIALDATSLAALPRETVDAEVHGHTSVSYTHLDVYKRQP